VLRGRRLAITGGLLFTIFNWEINQTMKGLKNTMALKLTCMRRRREKWHYRCINPYF
jgi:hypothetical protein